MHVMRRIWFTLSPGGRLRQSARRYHGMADMGKAYNIGDVTLAADGLASNIRFSPSSEMRERFRPPAGGLSRLETSDVLERLRRENAEARQELGVVDKAAEREELQRRANRIHDAPAEPLAWVDELRESVRDPVMTTAFESMDGKLQEAKDHVAAAGAVTDQILGARYMASFEEQTDIPGFWLGSQLDRLTSVRSVLSTRGKLDGTDDKGIISSFVTDIAAKRARNLAAAGRLDELREIERERHEWAEYLTLRSWDEQSSETGNTALFLACANAHVDTVEELISRGADVTIANKQGVTPLHIAGSRQIAELLLASGADPAAMDNKSRTPFMMAKLDHVAGDRERAQAMYAFAEDQQRTSREVMAALARQESLLERQRREEAESHKTAAELEIERSRAEMARIQAEMDRLRA